MDINIDRATGKYSASQTALTYSITVNDDFSLSKIIEIKDGENQKINEEGNLLYLDSEGNETIESKIEVKTDEGEEDDSIKWIDNTPIMIPKLTKKLITFAQDPTAFEVEEILQAKYKSLLEDTTHDYISHDYILADIFLNEEDIDLTDKDHAANTGVAIMQLLPIGQAKTKTITLEAAVSSFELLELESAGVDVYINDVKFVNNKAVLSAVTSEVVIKFKNTANKAVDVKSYAIAY
ncbi:hypothetical protein [Clostridium beijerinckii]|uniref:hypothetical protein n=1 Tax=Clostridium beijerinckii TaxID=1520 RepID=UPI0003D2A906|nr:hypothetical protein [Clostridium beijerinckii]ALB46202.1 hypothetical protein X276_13620 [Clostridium beijerinckii NRRL B-598]